MEVLGWLCINFAAIYQSSKGLEPSLAHGGGATWRSRCLELGKAQAQEP